MATCRFGGTNNCDGNAANYAMGDIVFGAGGNLFECVVSAGCSPMALPTAVSAEWKALVGGDAASTADRMEITSEKIEIYAGSTLRVVLGNLTT